MKQKDVRAKCVKKLPFSHIFLQALVIYTFKSEFLHVCTSMHACIYPPLRVGLFMIILWQKLKKNGSGRPQIQEVSENKVAQQQNLGCK